MVIWTDSSWSPGRQGYRRLVDLDGRGGRTRRFVSSTRLNFNALNFSRLYFSQLKLWVSRCLRFKRPDDRLHRADAGRDDGEGGHHDERPDRDRDEQKRRWRRAADDGELEQADRRGEQREREVLGQEGRRDEARRCADRLQQADPSGVLGAAVRPGRPRWRWPAARGAAPLASAHPVRRRPAARSSTRPAPSFEQRVGARPRGVAAKPAASGAIRRMAFCAGQEI